MKTQFREVLFATTCLVAANVASIGTSLAAAAPAVPVNPNGIGGVVTSSHGPEAGVWVIAETLELSSRTIKIVVTDDQGRFMLPDLPKAKYDIWVRGYGLVDSERVQGAPGKNMNLKAVLAADPKAAAEIFPANYWFSLVKVPAESEFPGTGAKGNGIAPRMQTQESWMTVMKDQCIMCHQVGNQYTRKIDNNTPEGWSERTSKVRPVGDQALSDGGNGYTQRMINAMTSFGRTRGLNMYADWTQRIAKGEVPSEAPPRPQGLERNIVLTSIDWGNGRFMHDLVVSDRHEPTVNANGLIYAINSTWGYIETLNPVTMEHKEVGYKVHKGTTQVDVLPEETQPTQFPHNPMVDAKGRLWITDLDHRPTPNPPIMDKPKYCNDGTLNKFAKYYPQSGRLSNTAVVYDAKANKMEGVPMCNGMHHLQFNVDRQTLYFSGGDSRVASWVDTKVWDETKDPQKSVGWCPLMLDTNSTTPSKVSAKNEVPITPDRTQWNDPIGPAGQSGEEGGGDEVKDKPAPKPFDAKKDTPVVGFLYGIDADISDGSMWFAKSSPTIPSGAIRFERGTNPPETCRAEYFATPKLADGKTSAAFGGRGVSVDSKGTAFVAYSSGQLGRIMRSKCKVLSGPSVAEGQHCPEGWTFFDAPGPKMPGVKVGTADYHYLLWVDLHDTFGLGKDTPIIAGSNSDSLLAFDQKTEKYNILRVPYPLGFHTRGLDGRIDDPKAGWKGKGLYATYSSQPVWHQEGGDDGASGPQMVKFQIRPDPLAF